MIEIPKLGAPDTGQESGSRSPFQPVRFPATPVHVTNQLQQIRIAQQAPKLSIGEPNVPSSFASQSNNLPKNVANITTQRQDLLNGSYKITIMFSRDASDANFQTVNVYLKQSNNTNPVIVASGTDSPLTFTIPKTSVPSAVIVQTSGNWGAVPVQNSPSKSLTLS